MVVWLPPWDGGTAHPASELSGAYCYFVAGDLVTMGIYETRGHGALKIKRSTQLKVTVQDHSTNKGHGSAERRPCLRDNPGGLRGAGAYNSLGCTSISSLTLTPPSAFRWLPSVRERAVGGTYSLGISIWASRNAVQAPLDQCSVFLTLHPCWPGPCPLMAELGARGAKLLTQKVPVERKTKPTNTSPVFSSSA